MPTGSDPPFWQPPGNMRCVIPVIEAGKVSLLQTAPPQPPAEPCAKDDRPACFVVDFTELRGFLDAVDDLARRWVSLSPRARSTLSRLLWLHPSGEVVQYRPPEDPPCRSDG